MCLKGHGHGSADVDGVNRVFNCVWEINWVGLSSAAGHNHGKFSQVNPRHDHCIDTHFVQVHLVSVGLPAIALAPTQEVMMAQKSGS